MKKTIFMVAAVSFGASLHAQDSSKNLQQVVVTATKFSTKQSETGKVLNVITQQQLQQNLGKSLPEILNQQAGITINGANNAPGTNQSIYLQGASAGNTLILLDGVPQNDASGITSEFDLNAFSIDQIERIEILKGAQSTLYGSDAVAGVINIITKKTGTRPSDVSLQLLGGSYNRYKGTLAISGNDGSLLQYYAGFTKEHVGGFSTAYDSTGTKGFDKDGFDQDAFTGSLGFAITNRLTVRVNAKINYQRNDLDAGAFKDDKDYTARNLNINLGASFKYLLKQGDINLLYNSNWFNRTYTDGASSVGGFATTQEGDYTGKSQLAEAYVHVKLHRNWTLLAGADYRYNSSDQRYSSTSAFGPFNSLPLSSDTTRTNQISGYASLFYGNQNWHIEAGGRVNHHSIYGNNATFSFNPSYLINNQVKLFANISSGYKVPSLYQLYSEYGNRNLTPEKSINLQAGVQYSAYQWSVRLLGFKRNINEVIIFFTDANYNSFYVNEDKQKDQGGEAELSYTITKGLTLTANYAYVDGKINTKTDQGKDTSIYNLYRRPKHTIHATLAYQINPKAFVSLHVKKVNRFYEPQYAAAPIEMAGYATIDFHASYKICNQLNLFADLQNLGNKTYFDLRGFNNKKFNFNTGLTLNF